MGNKNMKELNKNLKIENVCTIVALVAVIITTIANVWTFSMSKDFDVFNQILYGVFSSVVLGMLAWIFVDVKKIGTPFAKPVIKKLQIMAWIIMVAAFAPDLITQFVQMAAGFSVRIIFEITIGSKSIFIMWLGVIVGITSEIFKYGVKLQEDVDSIA